MVNKIRSIAPYRGFTPAQVWRQFSTNFNLVLCSIPSSQSLLAKQARMDPVPSNGLNDTPSNEQTMEDVIISMKNMRNMALKTEKDLVQLKQAIEIYHDAAENKQDKLTKTAISFQSFVIKDYHLGLSKTIEYVEKALTHCSNYEQMLNAQWNIQFLADIDRFSKTWRNERDNTQQQYSLLKSTLKKLKRKGNQHRRTEEYARELREAKIVQKRIFEALDELKNIMHKFVHSQLLYHSQCFQIWTQVMYNIKTHENLNKKNGEDVHILPAPLTREDYSDSEEEGLDGDVTPTSPNDPRRVSGVPRTNSNRQNTSSGTKFRAAAHAIRAKNRLQNSVRSSGQ